MPGRRPEQQRGSEAEFLKLQDKLAMHEKIAAAAQSREAEERRKREVEEQARMLAKLRSANEERPLEGRLSTIHAARFAPDALKVLLPQLGVSVGDPIDAAVLERVRAVVARFDEHVHVQLGRSPDGGLILLLVAP